MLIINISKEVLMGLDFLQMHAMAIDFTQGMVTWAREHLATRCRRGHEQACRVKFVEDVIIPAGGRTLVPGLASQPLAINDWIRESLLHTQAKESILAGKTLVQGPGRPILIEILNPTEERWCLKKKTNIRVIVRLLKAEMTSPAASQVFETVPADGAERHDRMFSFKGNLRLELQALVKWKPC